MIQRKGREIISILFWICFLDVILAKYAANYLILSPAILFLYFHIWFIIFPIIFLICGSTTRDIFIIVFLFIDTSQVWFELVDVYHKQVWFWFRIQREPENTGKGRWLSNSKYDLKSGINVVNRAWPSFLNGKYKDKFPLNTWWKIQG